MAMIHVYAYVSVPICTYIIKQSIYQFPSSIRHYFNTTSQQFYNMSKSHPVVTSRCGKKQSRTAKQQPRCSDMQARCYSKHKLLRLSNPSQLDTARNTFTATSASRLKQPNTTFRIYTTICYLSLLIATRLILTITGAFNIQEFIKLNLLVAASSNLAAMNSNDF